MSIRRNARNILGGTLLTAAVLVLQACGGGNDGQDFTVVTLEQLNGTWAGSLEDTNGVLHLFSVTIDAGSVTQVSIDGTDQNWSGALTRAPDAVFSVLLNGVDTRLFVDANAAHAVFLDAGFNFGVVEKNAAPLLPMYVMAESDGNWAGRTLVTDFTTFDAFPSSGTCTTQACTYTGNGVNADINLVGPFSAQYGNWTGTYTIAMPAESGDVSLLMSSDKNFAGYHRCLTGGVFPDDCTFTIWNRQ
jgi:hypothetical protein